MQLSPESVKDLWENTRPELVEEYLGSERKLALAEILGLREIALAALNDRKAIDGRRGIKRRRLFVR